MKFVTFQSPSGARLGLVDGTDVIDLNLAQAHVPADLQQALAILRAV